MDGAQEVLTSVDAAVPQRIADLLRLVDSGEFDLLSLDVFDTLVHREAVRPTDLFFQVAEGLRAQGALYPSSSPESFVRERIAAETRARAHVTSGEATLSQIWAEFPSGYLRGATAAEGMRLELELEQRHLRVHAPMRELIERARARGMQVAFVSDTYFTRAQIETLTGLKPDHLVVSSEWGLAKARGLHRHLLERTGVEAARVLHVGDDLVADVEGPAALGIARYWLRRFPEGYEDLLARELPETLSQRAPLVLLGDAGLTAVRSHAMAAVREPYERWGAGVLGPVVVGYAEWVGRRCAELGVDTVLCLMREGRVLREVFERLGLPVRARELFVSRFVALQASILAGSEDEIARFVLRPSAQPASRVLNQLGLEPADLPGLDMQRALEPNELRGLVRTISGTPALRRKVVRMSAGVRTRLLAHLHPLLSAGRQVKVALADLGYKGTIQLGLQRVLDHERLGVTTHGLYLVTGGDVHETQSQGVAAEGWLAENGQPVALAHTFMRSPEIYEQALMADCGTTLGHDAGGAPTLDQCHVPAAQRAQIAAAQRGLLAFAGEWAAYRANHGPAAPEVMRGLCRAIAVRSIARPLPIELELFGSWQHDENFGSGEARSLMSVVGLHEWEREHLSPHQLASLAHQRIHWPFGFAHAQGRPLGEAIAQIFLRTAEPWAFAHPAGPQPLGFHWDDGGGFRPETAAADTYTLDARGRCWHRASLALRGEPLCAVAFAFGRPGDLLRLRGIRVHWRGDDGRETALDLPAERLVTTAHEALAPGLLRVTSEPALVVATLPDAPGFRGVVHVDLFFTLVPGA